MDRDACMSVPLGLLQVQPPENLEHEEQSTSLEIRSRDKVEREVERVLVTLGRLS